MNTLLLITILVTAIPVTVYGIYILGATFSKPKKVPPLPEKPFVSIVIPAYNEELVIADRVSNLAESYPVDRMEIIISNDGSTDRTETVAKEALEKNSANGKVITHKRSGVNKTINRGIDEASSEIIAITGSDGLYDKNTLPDLLGVLLSDDKIGAVSGDMIPLAKGETVFSNSETAYRSIYGKICTWESNISSTYCLNGAVVAFKRKASRALNTRKGADDASMALSVIRNGYRCQYVQSAKFYEYVPHKFSEQKNQKIRRATRLLEATFANLDVLSPKYGRFGTFIFPLRIIMLFIVPGMTLLSIFLWALYLATIGPAYGLAFIVLVASVMLIGNWRPNILSSFILYQAYLFFGLFNMLRDVHVWEPMKREGM